MHKSHDDQDPAALVARWYKIADKVEAGTGPVFFEDLSAMMECGDALAAALEATHQKWLLAVEANDHTRQALERALAEKARLREQKDGAYAERDRLVAALSKVFPSWLERHPDADTSWDDDWRWIVFISFPAGQASWHIHDSELAWFDHLERREGNSWDGHTTPEKYDRIAALSQQEPTP